MSSKRKENRVERRRRELRRGLIVLGAVLALVVAGATAVIVLATRPAHHAAALPPRRVDGIPCGQEITTYHEHAHLTILDGGKRVPVAGNIGYDAANTCYYWIHTHDASGIIHLEGPHVFTASLGTLFDIWHQPLSRKQVSDATVKPGQIVQAWVNGRQFVRNPRYVRLHPYSRIVLEVGPPFVPPPPYKFPDGY